MKNIKSHRRENIPSTKLKDKKKHWDGMKEKYSSVWYKAMGIELWIRMKLLIQQWWSVRPAHWIITSCWVEIFNKPNSVWHKATGIHFQCELNLL